MSLERETSTSILAGTTMQFLLVPALDPTPVDWSSMLVIKMEREGSERSNRWNKEKIKKLMMKIAAPHVELSIYSVVADLKGT